MTFTPENTVLVSRGFGGGGDKNLRSVMTAPFPSLFISINITSLTRGVGGGGVDVVVVTVVVMFIHPKGLMLEGILQP